MIIDVDIDGVLAKCVESINIFYNRLKGTTFRKEDYFTMLFEEVWKITKDETRAIITRFFEEGHYPFISVEDGSQLVIQQLSRKHSMHVVSSRHNYSVQQTLRWLQKYFPDCFSGFHFTDYEKATTKQRIHRDLNCGLVLEDDLSATSQAATLGIEVLLFDQPWNQKLYQSNGLVHRVKGWQEAEAYLKQRGLIC